MEHPTSQMDLMPTIVEAAAVSLPKKLPKLDGKSLLGHLKGSAEGRIHKFMFHHCGTDVQAVRYNGKGGWGRYNFY